MSGQNDKNLIWKEQSCLPDDMEYFLDVCSHFLENAAVKSHPPKRFIDRGYPESLKREERMELTADSVGPCKIFRNLGGRKRYRVHKVLEE